MVHNHALILLILLLGTAKKMLRLWSEKNFLNNQTFPILQSRVDSIRTPSDIGKLPAKLDADTFTADELKNWTILFSLYALKGIIPKPHLDCWRFFVIACQYLCVRALTADDIKIADSYLLRFCRSYQQLYGNDKVTPNMHLHAHLADCLYDFGPIYSFWLFSFERCVLLES